MGVWLEVAAPVLQGGSPPGSVGEPTVLLVMEDPVLVDLVRLSLAPLGCPVEEVAQVEAAVDRLRAGGVGAVLVDLFCPARDPVEVLDRLRRAAGRAPVSMIGLSGLGLRRMVLAALRAGADDFVIKPPAGEILREKVARALARHAQAGVDR